MSGPGVLVVTNEQDVGADFVIRELAERRGAHVVRLNTERAAEWQLTVEPGHAWTVASGRRTLASSDCRGVWWRRPESAARPGSVEPAAREALCDQWRAFLAGLASVPGPSWVSSPFAIRAAENKALQLRCAAAVGLPVPETVWTNSRSAAVRLLSAYGDAAVCKSVTGAYWEADDVPRFVFARLVSSWELPEDERLALAPVAFQRAVTPKRDVRATVVGDRVLAAERQSRVFTEPLDWRLAPEGAWQVHDLPASVAQACVELVGEMALRFGGLDLVLDDAGRYWFIELNPNGEWGWLQAAGLPIAEALADELLDA